jgi:hypothetical protein
MAQSGYTPISLYYSTTASAAPTAGNLVAGELAINTLDGKLFYKDSAGVVQTIASKGTGTIGGSTTQVQYNSSGAFAGSANMTFDGTSLTLTKDLNLTNASNYNLYASGAGANYMAGSLGIGGTSGLATASLMLTKSMTGGTVAYSQLINPTVLSDVTSTASGVRTSISTTASAFTLTSLYHFRASQATIGSGSAVTTQAGFFADSTIIGATNNYGFQGSIAAATGAYNLYMSGTANNYLAGQLLVGTTTATAGYTALSPTQSANQYQVSIGGTNTFAGNPTALFINATMTGTAATTSANGISITSSFPIAASGTITSLAGVSSATTFNNASTTTNYYAFVGSLAFGASALGNTLTNAYTYSASAPSFNASATTAITTAAHFNAANIAGTAGAAITTAVAFYGRQAASNTGVTNNYNLYMSGSASNYLAGALGVGTTGLTGYNLYVNRNLTGAVSSTSIGNTFTVQSDVTTIAYGFGTFIGTQATSFTLPSLQHYTATQGTFGAGSTVTNQTGFYASAFSGGTNNFGFSGGLAAATGVYNLYMSGTAANYMAGQLGIGTASPNASALLDVQSTTQGVRMPNMTTTQKNAISSPAAGLMVFDTTLAKLCVYSGSAWQTITSV